MDKQTQRHKIKRREVAEVMLMRKTRKDSLYIIREPVAHRLDVIVCYGELADRDHDDRFDIKTSMVPLGHG